MKNNILKVYTPLLIIFFTHSSESLFGQDCIDEELIGKSVQINYPNFTRILTYSKIDEQTFNIAISNSDDPDLKVNQLVDCSSNTISFIDSLYPFMAEDLFGNEKKAGEVDSQYDIEYPLKLKEGQKLPDGSGTIKSKLFEEKFLNVTVKITDRIVECSITRQTPIGKRKCFVISSNVSVEIQTDVLPIKFKSKVIEHFCPSLGYSIYSATINKKGKHKNVVSTSDCQDTFSPPVDGTYNTDQDLKKLVELAKQNFKFPDKEMRIKINTPSIKRNVEIFNEENSRYLRHVKKTVEKFSFDNIIDVPLLVAVARRETKSGVLVFSPNQNDLVIIAGRDANTSGIGGLDQICKPKSKRKPLGKTIDCIETHSSDGREISTGKMKINALLGAYIVELNYSRYTKLRNHIVTGEGAKTLHCFSEQEREEIYLSLTEKHANRAWTQAAFGSGVNILVEAIRDGILNEIRKYLEEEGKIDNCASNDDVCEEYKNLKKSKKERLFKSIIGNDCYNLNSIFTNPYVRNEIFGQRKRQSIQRVFISTAEAWVYEQAVPKLN